MREETQLRVIFEVLQSFSRKELFSKHLKRFFHRNRQLGSRDRRAIQQFSFNYFRTGKMFSNLPVEERLAFSNYLLNREESPLLKYLLSKVPGIPSKEELLKTERTEALFPFHHLLSDKIDKESFTRSFLSQPKVWIRVRKNFLNKVQQELREKNIEFGINSDNFEIKKEEVNNEIAPKPQTSNCLYVKNTSSLDSLDSFRNGYFEIQDWASQQTIHFIQPQKNEYWWDACSGSGGKSLMMLDAEPSLKIYATDVRETVLQNLNERFRKAGIRNYISEKVDVANLPENFILPSKLNSESLPGGIVADVPCTGSGTWARTPEWIEMFDEASLPKFQKLQYDIVSNLVKYLPQGKPLIYITCSILKAENEDIITNFATRLPLAIEHSAYIKGYDSGADTMFLARLIKK